MIFAEGQAMRRIPMHMKDWIAKLDAFLNINDRNILIHAGKISHEMARQLTVKEDDAEETSKTVTLLLFAPTGGDAVTAFS